MIRLLAQSQCVWMYYARCSCVSKARPLKNQWRLCGFANNKNTNTHKRKNNNTVKESYSALSHAQVNELFTKWTHIYTHVCMLLSSDCRCFLFPNAPNVYIKCWLHFAKHHLCASLGFLFWLFEQRTWN